MPRTGSESPESSRIMLGLLDAVEQDRARSQRLLASELGVALGLVNAYLKRCVKKGLVKVRGAPARRYAYYLTPQGFAEKSRLTVEYLSYSFDFFRQAKNDCLGLFDTARARGIKNIVLAGQTDLAEIAALCAIERGIEILGTVQKITRKQEFLGVPGFADFDEIPWPFDAVMITDVIRPRETSDEAISRFGLDRVLIPDLLRIRIKQANGGKK